MASRNSFLDSPSFRGITTPSQRESISGRRRSSGFRGGGSGSSSPIRRETTAERTQRLRQERLSSFQSELADTGTRLTQSERQAILRGEDVSSIREQVVTRQRREGFANLQRDLSRSGTRLTREEAQAISSGDADPSSLRSDIESRRGRTFAQQRGQSFVTVGEQSLPVSEGFAYRVERDVASGALSEAQESITRNRRTRQASRVNQFAQATGTGGASFISGEQIAVNPRGMAIGVSSQERRSTFTVTETPRRNVAQRFLLGVRGTPTIQASSDIGDDDYAEFRGQTYPGEPDFDLATAAGITSNLAIGRGAGSIYRGVINFAGRRAPRTVLASQRFIEPAIGGASAVFVGSQIVNDPGSAGRIIGNTALQGVGFVRGARGVGITNIRSGTPRASGSLVVEGNVLRGSFTVDQPVTASVFGRQRSFVRTANVNVLGARPSPTGDFRLSIDTVSSTPSFVGGSPRFSSERFVGVAGGSSGAVVARSDRALFASTPVLESVAVRDQFGVTRSVVSDFVNVRGRTTQRGFSSELVRSTDVNVPRVDNFQTPNFGAFRIIDRPRTVSTTSGISRSRSVPTRSLTSRQQQDFGFNFAFDRRGQLSLSRQVSRSVNIPRPQLTGQQPSFSGFNPFRTLRGTRRTGVLFGSASRSNVGSASLLNQQQLFGSQNQFREINNLFSTSTSQIPISRSRTSAGISQAQITAPRISLSQGSSLIPISPTPPRPRGVSRPPVVPSFDFEVPDFGVSSRRTGSPGRSRRDEEFTPSLIANALNIRGSRRSRASTGIDIRPVNINQLLR